MPESDAARPQRRSPLQHRRPLQAAGGAVRLAELSFPGKHILRVDPALGAGPVQTALGLALPAALRSAAAGDTALLWLGPDEWMLVAAPGAAADCAAALAGLHHQLVDVGDYYAVIEVAGQQARALLMKLTTLDLHPRGFGAGQVAGSLFGRAHALMWQAADEAADGPAFRLFVRWSHVDYLWCLLAACGREWGLPEAVPVTGEPLTVA